MLAGQQGDRFMAREEPEGCKADLAVSLDVLEEGVHVGDHGVREDRLQLARRSIASERCGPGGWALTED